MFKFNKILLLIFLIVGFQMMICSIWAQNKDILKIKKIVENKTQDNLNKFDAQKRKQGMWFYDIPAKFGDPARYEFGTYLDGMKTGLWYKMSHEQELLAIEHFQFNELNGQAQYFEKGKLASMGTYRGIFTPYAFDTFQVTDPISLIDTTVITPAEKGFTKHGLWRYYDSVSGHLILEQEYQVDILLWEKKYAVPIATDVKREPVKLPHEGGSNKGWKTGKGKSRASLIK